MIRQGPVIDRDTVYRGPDEAGHVFLTFDDGPDPRFTPQILDILAQASAYATFFLVGKDAIRFPSLVRRIAQEGHEVANHTWSHCHPWTISSRVARQEVSCASAALSDILGRSPRYFRPPYGRLRRSMMDKARELGQTVVMWSLSAVDWGPWGGPARIARRLRSAKVGDIVLLHDACRGHNRPWETVRVLAGFLSELHYQNLIPSLFEKTTVGAEKAAMIPEGHADRAEELPKNARTFSSRSGQSES
ncbi:MAG: polysaccharide deacetylase family protein [Deltaproteobacteria bacterium]|nr:polysaccharide deacetylase family protein [Deltaproteobacteria bacterium]HDZ91428.1 polysaccharide deacetylase family protein [Deltaproteobacteria bacterium]